MRAVGMMSLAALVLFLGAPAESRAGWGVGVRVGVPYYRPHYGGYYRPYFGYGIGIDLAPAVVIAPAPVVVQPAPVVIQQVPVQPTLPAPAEPAPLSLDKGDNSDQLFRQLSDPNERVRAEAALQLGRHHVRQAVTPLTRMLTSDSNPQVRDAAARALGLIGSSQGLTALQTAAQADEDRDVRHSAAFAAEVIRSGLRR